MNRLQFQAHFDESIGALQQSEVVTRRELAHLSRHLVDAIHGFKDATLQGDIQFINKLLTVLTPVNRKVAVKFFEHFAGFHYDADVLRQFTKKSAKRAGPARAAAVDFIADPNQNIWTWADRHIEIEVKPFDDKKVTSYIEGQMKKAVGSGKTCLDVLRAVFAAGFAVDDITALMQEIEQMDKLKADAAAAAGVKPAEPALM